MAMMTLDCFRKKLHHSREDRFIQEDFIFVSLSTDALTIRRRSDYIIGFIAQAIGPNKSKKLTRPIAPVHNIRGKV